MANTEVSTEFAPKIRLLLEPAIALAAACRHGAVMIRDGQPVSDAIVEDAHSIPKLVAQIRKARTTEKAMKQMDILLIRLQRLSSLFVMSQNHAGLDELTLAVIENEIRLFRDKVVRVRAELSLA